VEGNGKRQDAPGNVLLVGARGAKQSPGSTVDVGLPGDRDSLDNIAPITHQRGHLFGGAAAGEPVAGLPEVVGGGVIAVEPDAALVEDLDQNVGTDGEGDARVEEVARVDDDGRAAVFGFEGAKGGEEVFDGAVAFQKVHVLGSAKEAVECGGKNNDGYVRPAAAQETGHFGAELSCSEVVVENGDIDIVEEFGCLLDRGRGNAVVTMLAENGGTEEQVIGLIIEQQDANTRRS